MSDNPSGQPAVESAQTAAPSATPESNVAPAAPETVQTIAPENNDGGQTETLTLTEEESKYLKSQNLDLAKFGIDQSNHEAVDNFINMHKSLRQSKQTTAATPADVMGTVPTVENSQGQATTTPAPIQPVQQPIQPVQPGQPIQSPSQMDIINMKNILDNQYPDIKEQVGTKEFYDGMRKYGFSPVSASGEFNVSSILQYADYLNTKAENTRLKSQANQVNLGLVPSTSDKVDVSLNSLHANGQNMTMNVAENIVLAGNALKRQGKTLSADDQAAYNRAVEILQGK